MRKIGIKMLGWLSAGAALALTEAGSTSGAAVDQIDDIIAASEALTTARLIPRETFLASPLITDVELSPKGDRLAFLTGHGRRSRLWLHDIGSGVNTLLFTSDLVKSLSFTPDGEFIVMATAKGIAVTPVSKEASPAFITALDPSRNDLFHGVDPRSDHHILVSLYDNQQDTFTLYRVDMNGTRHALHTSPDILHSFITDKDGGLAFYNTAEELTQLVHHISGGKDRIVRQCDYGDGCAVIGYNEQDRIAYFKGRYGGDLQGLVALDLESGTTRLIHRDPENRFDIDRAYFDLNGRPLMVAYDTDYRKTYGINGKMDGHVAAIEAALKSKLFYIVPTAKGVAAKGVWLVINNDPRRASPTFHLYRLSDGSVTSPLKDFINSNTPRSDAVNPEETALKTAFWYQASDGFMLHAYLTLPRGIPVATAPMVVMPHGGPWNRTLGRYSTAAQFLANRGYIVFEPNFRSSTGFGLAYILEANRDFGDGRVQGDITDGVQHLLQRGIGDPKRLAIYGHSFGGFSALTALTFTPDLFKVGIAGAPPPSLSKALAHYIKAQEKTSAGVLRSGVMAKLAVDLENAGDTARLYDQSPDKHTNRVTKPLYIIAGKRDRRVNILDVRDYAVRLEENGTPVFLLSLPDQGHSFRKPLAREAYFYLLETALARHIGGQREASIHPKLTTYIRRNTVIGDPLLQN